MDKWKIVTPGALIKDAGNAKKISNANWRTFKPVVLNDKCIHCMKCWIVCPDSSIKMNKKGIPEINYNHCKGCGLCSQECPVKAIVMKPEDKE